MTASKSGAAKQGKKENRLYTLEVVLTGGPMTEDFTDKNPVVSRTVEIRGDQTLAKLHDAIFRAFDREEEHLYEFQVGGKGRMDPKARKYAAPDALDDPTGKPGKAVLDASRTDVGSLGVKAGEEFTYWFDFGDDWWHRVRVVAVAETAPSDKYPKVTKRVGKSPPQYADLEGEEEEEDEEKDEDEDGNGEKDEDEKKEEDDEEEEKGNGEDEVGEREKDD